jgi:hypothetical protein
MENNFLFFLNNFYYYLDLFVEEREREQGKRKAS